MTSGMIIQVSDNIKELIMELLQILGWIYLGVMLGSVFGVIALSLFIGPKMKQYEVNIEELEEEKKVLKHN